MLGFMFLTCTLTASFLVGSINDFKFLSLPFVSFSYNILAENAPYTVPCIHIFPPLNFSTFCSVLALEVIFEM